MKNQKSTTMKHTQGQWTIKEPTTRTFKERTEIWVEGDQQVTFEIIHNEKSLRETRANAALIVSAPELLEAAINLTEDMDSEESFRLLIKAIQKAKQ